MVLEVKNLTKAFGENEVIKNVSFQIKEGEIFALIGPNGSGKTTIIKLIAGLLRPTSGQIFIEGYDVVKNPVEAKSRIGYIPDEPIIWQGMTGLEFLHFSGALYKMSEEERTRNIKKLLSIFNLFGIQNNYFEDYSRGNKQKFAILGALLHKPKLLLIDEPIVGLDPQSAQIAQDLFRDFAQKGGAILLVTHTLEVVEAVATKIGFIKNGKLLIQGFQKDIANFLKLKSRATLQEIYASLNK